MEDEVLVPPDRKNEPGHQYPPEPWDLRGTAYGSWWWVPVKEVEHELPLTLSPVGMARRALVTTLWTVYEHGGVLQYDEFMCAVLVKPLRERALHVTHIWVNSETAAAGGRELWGVPKQLGVFCKQVDGREFAASLSAEGQKIAMLRFERTVSIPCHVRITGLAAQMLRGRLQRTRLQAHGRLHLGHAKWQFTETGPLRYLAQCSPMPSFQLSSLRLRFGGFLPSPS